MDRDEIIPRFLAKVNKAGKNGCWEWIGAKSCNNTRRNSAKYGQFNIKGKHKRAHRISYMLFKGPIPENMCVCHTCDNASCVNPDHLFLGSYADNNADRDRKGRQVPGKKLKYLTAVEVFEIKNSILSKIELQKKYNVSFAEITKIKTPIEFKNYFEWEDI